MNKVYRIGNISDVPEKKGVYSWYLRPRLSTYDIEKLINAINENTSQAEKFVEEFLNKFLFDPLNESPYDIKVYGKLKPKYQGKIDYIRPNSSSLISRISSNPELLYDLKKIFEKIKHDFLSPIYIGMADNLNKRLSNHVNLMKKFREFEASSQSFLLPSFGSMHIEEGTADHKFAHEVVVQRKLDINELEVHILEIDYNNNVKVDVENILNRINYPLCGRN